MDTLTWVIMANAAVWIGIGSYMAFLAARPAFTGRAPCPDGDAQP